MHKVISKTIIGALVFLLVPFLFINFVSALPTDWFCPIEWNLSSGQPLLVQQFVGKTDYDIYTCYSYDLYLSPIANASLDSMRVPVSSCDYSSKQEPDCSNKIFVPYTTGLFDFGYGEITNLYVANRDVQLQFSKVNQYLLYNGVVQTTTYNTTLPATFPNFSEDNYRTTSVSVPDTSENIDNVAAILTDNVLVQLQQQKATDQFQLGLFVIILLIGVFIALFR